MLKKQRVTTQTSFKPQIWTTIASRAQSRPPLYKLNNKIIVKLNNNAPVEEMKKQASEVVTHKSDAYLIKNNITITKLCAAQILPSRDVVIQTTNAEKVKNLKSKDGWTKVLGNKTKLLQKR